MRPLALAALLALALPASATELVLWRLENGAIHGSRGDDRPLPVGSLLKPFVAKAWARAHPGEDPPVVQCKPTSGCWRPSGHGSVGLVRALAVSCNTYFKKMAAQTPVAVLEATLRAEGFVPPSLLTPEAAIGLGADDGAVTARPEALLRAYARLVGTPWNEAEGTRRDVLAGLRDSAAGGTASGLGRRGFWAKTGTVPALDGRPLGTSGWVVAVDDSGWAVLGLLEKGTGHEAAEALAEPLGRLRPWSGSRSGGMRPPEAAIAGKKEPRDPAETRVRIGLLEALHPRTVVARNLGSAPAGSSRGYVGPEASLSLRLGDRLEESLWELALPGRHFLRRLRGGLAVEAGPLETLRLRAELRPEEYVAGVVAAELPAAALDRRIALGAAVLRFLADGPRHASTDVCDQTHCAWFVGRGPRVLWVNPGTPVVLASSPGRETDDWTLDGGAWARIRAEALQDGPRLFTGHCGGAPLSAHFVWGNGDDRVWRCDRHSGGDAAPWSRLWSGATVSRALGATVTRLEAITVGGVWTLRARTPLGDLDLRYDEAHRRLAAVLGWDALPSPADRILHTAGGFRAEGVGSGHRVGLCLGE